MSRREDLIWVGHDDPRGDIASFIQMLVSSATDSSGSVLESLGVYAAFPPFLKDSYYSAIVLSKTPFTTQDLIDTFDGPEHHEGE